jgi:hypothetical protein
MATLTQERRLTGAAPKQIMQRFEALDAQTGEVMERLRNTNSQRAFIWAHRDGLYRSQLACRGCWRTGMGRGGVHRGDARAAVADVPVSGAAIHVGSGSHFRDCSGTEESAGPTDDVVTCILSLRGAKR